MTITLKNNTCQTVIDPIIATPPVVPELDYGDFLTGVTVGILVISVLSGLTYAANSYSKGVIVQYTIINTNGYVYCNIIDSSIFRMISAIGTAAANSVQVCYIRFLPSTVVMLPNLIRDPERVAFVFSSLFAYYIFRLYNPHGIVHYPNGGQLVVPLIRDITITREIVVWVYPDKATSMRQALKRSTYK